MKFYISHWKNTRKHSNSSPAILGYRNNFMKQKPLFIDDPKVVAFDWVLFIPVLLLIAVGLVSIYSSTADANASSYFYRQLSAVGLGLVVMTIIVFLPKNFVSNATPYIYGISVLLLVIVLLFGTVIYGTKGWLRIGSFSLQPAELAKFGLLLGLAKYISSKGVDVRNIRGSGISILLSIIPALLIYLQPDHGTVTVIIAILGGVLYWAGFNPFILFFIVVIPVLILLALKGFVFYVVGAVVFSGLAILFKRKIVLTLIAIGIFVSIGFIAPIVYGNLQDHQKSRIETFLNPGNDPRGTGYNVIQSKMAVGSGGLTGKGFMQGTQTQLRYIPMQRTDFIYSVPTEEFGFLGGAFVLLLFSVLLVRLVSLASMFDKFSSVIAAGTAMMFLYHCIINIGMVIGLIPVMGIPLPFMSYGGSSMLINLAVIGIILNSYRNHKIKRNV
ncbi:MAG: rod shape-determining protein RodA [Ignavibacteriae bacterium HGW-Ignavibacteriae-1]|nr:MAG: rod shape-determining protein RodA [Ignavibacteriae bacterium HGW-Ignavibacteriae-1]